MDFENTNEGNKPEIKKERKTAPNDRPQKVEPNNGQPISKTEPGKTEPGKTEQKRQPRRTRQTNSSPNTENADKGRGSSPAVSPRMAQAAAEPRFDDPNWPIGGRRFQVGAVDPVPFQDPSAFWRSMAQFSTITMAVIMIGAVLFFTRSLVMPVVSALVISLTLAPLSVYATKKKLPAWIPAIIIVAGIAGALYLAIVLLSEPASDLIARSAEIGNSIKTKFQFMERPLAALRELRAAIGGSAGVTVDVSQPTEVIGSVVGAVTPAALQFVLFFATLFFFIFGRAAFRRYIVNLLATRNGRLRSLKIANDIERSLSGYLITVTIINLCVGLVAIGVTWALGFPAPLLWGVLAFVLNYIPYVGPGIMHVTLFAIGLMTFDTLLPALIAPLFFMGFTFFEGHFLVPNIIGRQLLLHPLAVFLSLAFWAWLWGPIGALLATPILIMVTVATDHLYPRDKQTLPE